MRIEPITPTIGANVSDVDIADLDAEQFAAIHAAFLQHGVLAFREQTITANDQVAFAQRFGDIDEYPFKKANRHFAPHPDGIDGIVRLEHDERNPGYENTWHIDMTWRSEPPMGSVLRAIELPPSGGGDTMFSSLGAAYDALDAESQRYLGTLVQPHDWLQTFGRNMEPSDLAAFRSDLPCVTHPVVRTHPETGRKVLFVNRAFGLNLPGLPLNESYRWLEHLYALIATAEFQCRIKWEPGTIVMWDNRAVAHYAVNDYYPERRVMDRVTVAGDKPY